MHSKQPIFMEITWQQSNWQNSQLNSRQAIVFVVSAVLMYLLLLIPVQFKTVWLNQDSQLSVSLVKNILVKEKNITKEIKKPIIETTKPIIKPIEEVKYPVKEQVVKPLVKQTPINKVIAVKPKLPSAGVILNSLKTTKPLPTVNQDFRQTSENDLDFKPKQWTKPQETKLIVDHNQMQEIVNKKTPLALKALRSAVGFFITPVEDRVKTADTLNYCPTLGRRSVFCPNANPLLD